MFGTFFDKFSGQELDCMKECSCVFNNRLAVLKSKMPALYREADLGSIEAWLHKHEKQTIALQKVKESPFSSYLFLGSSGVGKSYIAWALWKNAAAAGRRTPLINSTAELMQEYIDYAKDSEAERPSVLPSDLTQTNVQYTILLDEVAEFKQSEFTLKKFFELVKTTVDYGHQLIVTSNKRIDALQKVFGQEDKGQGAAIMRRLIENAKLVEMWK